jgi:hypothetical protein
VVRDVLNGYVSPDAARDDYGVVVRRLAPASEPVLLVEDFELDEAATAALRGSARSRCGGDPGGTRSPGMS